MTATNHTETVRVLTHHKADIPLARFREDVVMAVVRKLPARVFSTVMHLRIQRDLRFFVRPKTFTERIVHKKLTNRDPLLTVTSDKYAVRAFVSERVGEQYLIPLQQVASTVDDFDFEALHGKVVIKGTHGCNMTMVVDASKPIDETAIRHTAQTWLNTRWYHMWKEWAYKDIVPRLIAEQFIGTSNNTPTDYKFHVMHGRAEFVQIDTDRFGQHKSTMVRRDWRMLNVAGTYDSDDVVPPQPGNYDEMLRIAETLGAPFEHARIDLYNVDGQIYFGEITHYPGGASVAYKPKSFDRALGDLWGHGTPIPEQYLMPTAN